MSNFYFFCPNLLFLCPSFFLCPILLFFCVQVYFFSCSSLLFFRVQVFLGSKFFYVQVFLCPSFLRVSKFTGCVQIYLLCLRVVSVTMFCQCVEVQTGDLELQESLFEMNLAARKIRRKDGTGQGRTTCVTRQLKAASRVYSRGDRPGPVCE